MPRTQPAKAKKTKKARRYPLGAEPTYDGAFLAWESRDAQTFLSAKDQVLYLLTSWRGDAKGQCPGDRGIGKIPSVLLDGKQKLQAVHDDFERLRQRAINEGKVPPDEMPRSLRDRQLQAEAMIDVARVKIIWLEDMLASHTEKKEKKRTSVIGRKGPVGSGKLSGGILIQIDGQRVSTCPDGFLYIDEPDSPFNRLHVSDYRTHITKVWGRRMSKFRGQMSQFESACDHAEKTGGSFDGKKPEKPEWPRVPKSVQLVKIQKS